MTIEAIFEARSIAIVGASADARKFAGKVQTALVRHDYTGELVPINPKYTELFGRPCYPSLAEAPDTELVILAVRSDEVLDVLEEAGKKGARGAFVVSAGFAEIGEGGRRLQSEIKEFAARTGIRVLGPNCQGAYKVGSGVCTSFATPFLVGDPIVSPGPLAWISQSGAVGGAAVTTLMEQGLGLAYYVSTGNEADLDIAAVLSYVLEDDHTELVCGYVEEIKDGPGFARAMNRARELGKPVIMIRGGGTEAGAEATRLHTGALTHGPGVVEQFLRQCGVLVVRDLEELVAAATAFVSGGGPVGGERTAIIGNSGGLNAILADGCSRHGFTLAKAEGAFLEAVTVNVPSFIAPGNPIDLSHAAGTDPAVVGRLVRGLGDSVDWIFVCLYSVYSELGYRYDELFGELRRAAADVPARIGVLFYGSDPAAPRLAREAGLPVFTGVETMLSAIEGARSVARLRARRADWQPVPVDEDGDRPARAGGVVIAEHDMKARLARAGVAVPRGRAVTTDEDAVSAASWARYPVVAKISSEHIVHKAAAGAVAVGIEDERGLRDALARLREAARAVPGVGDQPTILVEQQVGFDVEIMLGLERVPRLGVMTVFGAGGSMVESVRDVASCFSPLTRADAEGLVGRTAVGQALADHPEALDRLVGMVLAIEALFIAAPELAEMDVNPIGLNLATASAVVLDAVAVSSVPVPGTSGQPLSERSHR